MATQDEDTDGSATNESSSGTEPTAETGGEPDESPDTGAASAPDGGEDRTTRRTLRRVSFSVRSLLLAVVIAGLVAACGVMSWLYVGAESQLRADERHALDAQRAEQVALDYAVNAAVMDFKDLGPWKQNLVKGTTPELTSKLTDAANAMEQIVLPLQWTSTAKPLAAKVRSDANGLYVVDAFVGVMTKTVQAAESLQSTATYSITVNSNNNWLISDVGGIATIVGDK
ncbi:hypothetical protein [Mycobacterium kyogaense]|uniref:hypothetical protein n=1 Tax=Mycobacterium kyogaense TaxID=2212479 RepID=UPI003B835DC4